MSVAVDAAPVAAANPLAPLRAFVRALTALADGGATEASFLDQGSALLRRLVAEDGWLPDAFAVPDSGRYRQYLLYRDPADRFSVVSFVWGPGQQTPIHDHTVWGLVGVLRGAELAERYEHRPDGLHLLGSERLPAGAVDAVSPAIGDVHRVSNALGDQVTISIHVYGADIGKVRRSTYDSAGRPTAFVSGYAEAPALPLWID
jgi:predicted metal-dependent enzyme (double-stranded beta helix superfamily)